MKLSNTDISLFGSIDLEFEEPLHCLPGDTLHINLYLKTVEVVKKGQNGKERN